MRPPPATPGSSTWEVRKTATVRRAARNSAIPPRAARTRVAPTTMAPMPVARKGVAWLASRTATWAAPRPGRARHRPAATTPEPAPHRPVVRRPARGPYSPAARTPARCPVEVEAEVEVEAAVPVVRAAVVGLRPGAHRWRGVA